MRRQIRTLTTALLLLGLRRLFCLSPAVVSNYDQYDRLFAALVDCVELRGGQAKFYFRPDSKGMPGGRWNPKYQPVGVVKVKAVDA